MPIAPTQVPQLNRHPLTKSLHITIAVLAMAAFIAHPLLTLTTLGTAVWFTTTRNPAHLATGDTPTRRTLRSIATGLGILGCWTPQYYWADLHILTTHYNLGNWPDGIHDMLSAHWWHWIILHPPFALPVGTYLGHTIAVHLAQTHHPATTTVTSDNHHLRTPTHQPHLPTPTTTQPQAQAGHIISPHDPHPTSPNVWSPYVRPSTTPRALPSPTPTSRPLPVEADTPLLDSTFPLAINEHDHTVMYEGRFLLSHGVAIGATQSGKTTTLMRLITGWMLHWHHHHLPLVVIDMKGSPALRDYIFDVAAATNRTVDLLTLNPTPHAATHYNPLAWGTPAEITERLMTMMITDKTMATTGDAGIYSEESHVNLAITTQLLLTLTDHGIPRAPHTPWTRTLTDLAALLEPTTFAYAAATVPTELAHPFLAHAHDLKDNTLRASAAHTLRTRIQRILTTSAHASLTTPTNTTTGLNFYDTITSGNIALLSLNAPAHPIAAKTLGNLAIADLGATLGRLLDEQWATTTGKRIPIIIDEIGAFEAEAIRNLQERATEAGASVMITAQTPENIRSISENFYASTVSNALLHIYGRITHGAELIAENLGTTKTFEHTYQTNTTPTLLGKKLTHSGMGSLKVVDTFTRHPNQLRDLSTGQTVIWTGPSRNPITGHDHYSQTHLALILPPETPPTPQRTPTPPAPHHPLPARATPPTTPPPTTPQPPTTATTAHRVPRPDGIPPAQPR